MHAHKTAAPFVKQQISAFWPLIPKSEVVAVYGATEEYSSVFPADSNVVILTPKALAAQNNGAVVDEFRLPLRDSELDKLLVIHGLEYSLSIDVLLKEFWRVLKPSGKIIMVCTNKNGLWKKRFGGRSLDLKEIRISLLVNKLYNAKIRHTLFFPPFLPATKLFNNICKILSPLCGVYVIEAEKSVYSPRGRTLRVIPSLFELLTKPKAALQA